jgi:DNA-binding transcriptional LysR family regulator
MLQSITLAKNTFDITALQAFEAMARLRSFTAAVGGHPVTHGAISRQVRSPKEALDQRANGLHVAEAFEHFSLLIQAAKCGLGIAKAPLLLVKDGLRAGSLVALIGFVWNPNRPVLWLHPHLGSSPPEFDTKRDKLLIHIGRA